MKVTETNFRKPSLRKVTIVKLNYVDKPQSRKQFTSSITQW